MENITFLYLGIFVLTCLDFSYAACNRKPQGATGDRSPVDENYQIQINGNPVSYIPGQLYNISLFSSNSLKFTSFTLSLEADTITSALIPESAGSKHVVGHFEIIDNAETKFSTLCENMIESSNTNTKNRVDVAWVAPSDSQSSCVLFKAAILQHRDVWFIDDGFLTKRLCPEEIDEINSQTPPVDPCCACDEAKYEVIVERKWRRNTHAKDFPTEPWRTKLGDVIGASHSLNFSFWKYGGRASQGLRELAEHGATKTLEKEIKMYTRTGSIRTIIKAPGIKYRPNITGKTLATVRVGPSHHVISLVLKIDPSPDWILGVSGLELCLSNCTWIEKKILNLYPWDVGTDSGPSYMSPDQAQHPPDVIRRISSTFPSDYRSPFFDSTGVPMKPLATLHVMRKRTYERDCNLGESSALECSTHPWSSWTECSVKCGSGTQYRLRSYKDPKVAESFNCNVVLRQNQNCVNDICGSQAAESSSAECELTNWSAWSECSKSCGKGYQTRTRDYNNPYAREKCQAGLAVNLQETRPCNGENCGGNIFTSSYDTNNNNIYDPNYEEQEAEQNIYQNSKSNRKSFSKGQQRTDWRSPEAEDEQSNYDGPDNNMSSNYDNENGGFENVNNIYGNEKLVGSRSRQPYEQDQAGYTNTFGDLEPNFSDTKRVNNNKNIGSYNEKDVLKKQPNKYYNLRDRYGIKVTESYNEDKQNENFCLEKPLASTKRCNKKRLVVKNYWFYDADDGECKLYTADNCDENRNKFLSMEKCSEICSQTIIPEKQDIMPFNNRGFDITQQPPFRARWN